MISAALVKQRTRKLQRVFLSEPQIGLVLGAGVSIKSGVPGYLQLTLDLCGKADDKKLLASAPRPAVQFLRGEVQRLRSEGPSGASYSPEEIARFLTFHLGHDHGQTLARLVRDILYGNLRKRSKKMVEAAVYGKNDTLDSVISFCAACPGPPLAPGSPHRVEVNPKVGGILTTNYDFLVEGAFGSKFGRALLKPVGRTGAREYFRDRRVIPVYHIHGYVSYVPPEDDPAGVKASELVIAEDDYFRVFHDSLGFENFAGMSFLHRFPCLFIGASMKDRNLRRYLDRIRRELMEARSRKPHFAILKAEKDGEDEFNDAVLATYGVEAIWVKEYSEITTILGELYTAIPGVRPRHWNDVQRFRWHSKRTEKAGSLARHRRFCHTTACG